MIFDGKKFAAEKEEILKAKVADLRQKGSVPKLVSLLVGDNLESELYTRLKQEAAKRIGITFEVKKFDSYVDPEKLIQEIKTANNEVKIQGVMVQLPLPESFEIKNLKLEILGSIEPKKDVDCLTPENLGLLMMGKPRFLPATVKAVVEIIKKAIGTCHSERSEESPEILRFTQDDSKTQDDSERKWLAGENVCIVGASDIVGRPLAMVLSDAGATVTLCRSTTKNLAEFTQRADLLISSTGVVGIIKKEMVKERATVIDVGIKKIKEKIFGDVDQGVYEMAGFITPVPGGVGPVTVVSLLENLIEAARQNGSHVG